MPGLNLNVGGYGSGSAGYGSLPTAANVPSGTTINQAAFGIGNSQNTAGPATAGFGTLGLGIAGAIVLTWLWYTLPR